MALDDEAPRVDAYNFREVTGSCTTGKLGARLASGAQLWRLNQLGILREALNAEKRVSADRARELLKRSSVSWFVGAAAAMGYAGRQEAARRPLGA